MTTINDIPFSFLVAWSTANKSDYPELTYLRTLSKKPQAVSFGNWGNVLLQLPTNKSLLKLQKALDKCKDAIIHDYEEDSKVLVLPSNASSYSGFYERVKAFIVEFGVELVRPTSNLSQFGYEAQKKRATIFKETFEYNRNHCAPTSRDVIASHLHLSRQRIDQLLGELTLECRDCLTGKQIGRVIADPLLVSEFDALKCVAGGMISRPSFLKYSGLIPQDGRTLEFLVSMLDMMVMENEQVRIPIITANGLLTDYTGTITNVLDYFREEVIGIRPDIELKAKLDEIEDKNLRKAILSLVMNSEEFVKYNDNQYVTLRWDHLKTRPARICWILYENKAFEYSSAISEKDLVKLYNAYARQYGERTITKDQLPSTKAGDCWKIMTLGRSGFWKIRRWRGEDYSLDSIVRDYIKNNGVNSFDGFLNYIKTSGQDRFYKPSTVRTRWRYCGGKIKQSPSQRTVNTHIRYTDKEKQNRYDFILNFLSSLNAQCTLSELYKEFLGQYPGTNEATFRSWVKDLYNNKKINYVRGTGQRPSYVFSRSVSITLPRTPANDIADKAVDIIWDSSTHEILSRDLTPLLMSLVPISINSPKTYISKALHNDKRLIFKGSQGHSSVGLTRATMIDLARKKTVVYSQSESPSINAVSKQTLKLDIPELKSCLIKEFSGVLKDYGIDSRKAVDSLITILGMGQTISENFSFYDALTYVPAHYNGTLASDREFYLMKDSLALVERFLKNYHELKYGEDVVAAIQIKSGTTKSAGLGEIITYLEKEYDLLPYKKIYNSKEERKVLYLVKDVVKERNKMYGHPDQYKNLTKYLLETNIYNSFFVMLYVSSKY